MSGLSVIFVSIIIYILKTIWYISPAHSSKFSILGSIYFKCIMTNCSLAPRDASFYSTLTSAHGTIIYLPIGSSHKTCLSGLHFILLHSNKLPSPIDFPYKYFLKPLHCSSFPLPKFPPPLSATSLSYQVLLFYWESLFLFFFWNSLFNCFPKLNFLHSCPPIRTCSPLHTGAMWSITRRFWNILNIAYSALVSANISHHLLHPPYIQFLWLSSSGLSFFASANSYIFFSLSEMFLLFSLLLTPVTLTHVSQVLLRDHFLHSRVRP